MPRHGDQLLRAEMDATEHVAEGAGVRVDCEGLNRRPHGDRADENHNPPNHDSCAEDWNSCPLIPEATVEQEPLGSNWGNRAQSNRPANPMNPGTIREAGSLPGCKNGARLPE